MSFSEEPPSEAITGRRALAIFSINTQSLTSELASLTILIPSSTQRSTEASSKGVAGYAAVLHDGLHQGARSSLAIRVSTVFLI